MKYNYNKFCKLFFISCILVLNTSFIFNNTFALSNSDKYPSKYLKQLNCNPTKYTAVVKISNQELTLYRNQRAIKKYPISSAKRGIGQIISSRQTPIGLHKIVAKRGDSEPHYAIYKGGRFTGRVWPSNTPRHLHRYDHIVTRVIVLEGLEPGVNKGRNKNGVTVDSQSRGILIHGTTMEWKLGTPASIGCVHLSSKDVIEFYNTVPEQSLVLIIP